MKKTVHVVDYGIGNLYSVERAIEKVGGNARLTSDALEIAAADRLILPGVGAFRDGMAGLRRAGVAEAIRRHASSDRPLLGICLGMQMLATEGTEYGIQAGLDIIPGRVSAIPSIGADGQRHKVPYIGWTGLTSAHSASFAGTMLEGLNSDDAVYLVHSYQFLPTDPADLLATYDYEGMTVTAAVAHGNIIGFQFHPERSARVGLALIDRFLCI